MKILFDGRRFNTDPATKKVPYRKFFKVSPGLGHCTLALYRQFAEYNTKRKHTIQIYRVFQSCKI